MPTNNNTIVSREEISRLSKKAKHCIPDKQYCRISTIQFPEDLLYEIFLMLPVKSLIRFRCVSKGMCRMIDSPIFVKTHNNHRSESGKDRSLPDDYAIILKEVWFRRLLSVNFVNDYLNLAKAVEFNCTLPKESIFLIGCCNGIFCFGNILRERCFLWNPSNGTFQRVEWSNLFSQRVTAVSIGYDFVRDDFKIICLLGRRNDTRRMEVYSLRKKSWRKFNGNFPSGTIIGSRTGVCVSGAMHLLWKNPTDNSRFIAAFDFVTETFRSLSLPVDATELEFELSDLKDFGGRLSITVRVDRYAHEYNVWVMEKYGVESSWTKLYDVHCTSNFYYYPNRERRLLYCHLGRLTWWDPQDKSYERIEFPGRIGDQPRYCEAYIYVRNLFRLDQSFV